MGDSHVSDFIDKSEILKELDNYEKGKGSWVYSEINGVKTKVYTKYLIGTTAAAASTSVVHGIADQHKILFIFVFANDGAYRMCEYQGGAFAANAYDCTLTAANVMISHGVNFRSKPYRMRIDYYE